MAEFEQKKDALGKGTQTWGFAVRIPESAYYKLIKKFPHFNSKNAEVREHAWRTFFTDTEEGRYYMNNSGRS